MRKIKTQSNDAGFTLIEMIIVIFLFAILLIGLLNIFDWQQKVYNLEQADVLATGSARVVMNNFTIKAAQGVGIEASRTISGTTYTTGGSTVVFKLPAYDSSGNLLSSTYDYVVFTKDGTAINQIIEADNSSDRNSGTKQLSDQAETFDLTYNNADVTLASQVTVDLTTRAYFRGNQSVSAHLAETVFLRNK